MYRIILNVSKYFLILCSFTLLFFFSKLSLASDDLNASERSLQPVTLQLKWKHQFQFAGYYAALEKGFYRKAGLDVRLLEIKDGEDSTDKVVEGKADFGIAMSDLILHRAKGQPVVALAAIFQHSPLIILAPKSSGIENIHALKEKRLGMEAHSAELIAYMENEGISLDEFEIVPHDYSVSSLILRQVDGISAYSTDEPFILLDQGIEYSTFTPRAGGIDFYGDTLFTSETQIREHPERVASFLAATLKGWQYALENSEEIVDLILSKYTQRHSREHLLFEASHSKSLIMADVVELGYMHIGRWNHIAQTYAKLGMVDESISLDGFLYAPDSVADYGWLKRIIGTLAIICLLLGLGALILVFLNRKFAFEVNERKQSEKINNVLFSISNAVNISNDLDDLYRKIHHFVGEIIDVTNFFIAALNERNKTLYFPYYVDSVDKDFSPITNFDPEKSLTGFVVTNRKPLLIKEKQLQLLAKKNGVWGPVPLVWMGVPLVIKNEIIGVMAVQSYTDPHLYDERDLEVLVSISDQMAIAIDRKSTENELIKSEKKYRELFDLAQEGIWVIDKDHNTTLANPSMAKMLGYTPEEMTGKNLFDFMDEQGIKIATNKIEQRKDGIAEQHDFEFIRKDGERIYTTMETAPIFDTNGKYNGAIAGILDTTDQKHKERVQSTQLKLVEYASTHTSQELLINFLDEAEDLTESKIGFYHFFDDENKSLSLQTWSSNTLNNMCKAEKTSTHYPLEKAGVWADCVRNREPVIHNNYDRLPHKKGIPEGHAKVIRELVVPVIRRGDIVAVLGVGNKGRDYNDNDVDTVQVLADLAWETVSRKIAEESLQNNQDKLENMLQSIHAGVTVHDVKKSKIVDFNSAALKILGLTGEQILGKSTVEPGWNFITEQGVAMDVDAYPANIVKRTKKPLFDYIVGVEKPSQSEPTWAIVKATPQFDQNEELRQVIVSAMDITTLKKTQSQLRKKDQQLIQSQKMESIGNLAGGIAHDFNNILSSILGFTELALEEAEKGSNQAEDLQEVYAAGNRAKELVKQILAFARQSEEKLKPVRPSDIIADTLKLLRPSTPTSIEIVTRIDSSSSVLANPSQLHQVVLNLCTNSIHALQSHGETLEIGLRDIDFSTQHEMKISALGSDKYIELSITDNGPGVNADIIDNIFEPYYTTKGVGEGTGMGLAMVKGIVESWGGQIAVNSEPRKKTTFTVILPISTSRDLMRAPQSESYQLGTEHILFVDDEPPIARMGSRILESLGYKVTVRTSSVEALELFREKFDEFDLVISDMTMPSMTGDELSIEIRRIKRDIPIIICTGYSIKMNDEGAKQIGINAFAYKPFTKSDFAKTIREVLDAC